MTESLSGLGWSAHFMRQLDEGDLDRFVPARLTRIHRAEIEALTEAGPQTLTTGPEDSTGAYAVGDWVLVGEHNRIERLLVRQSLLQRRAAGHEAKAQLIGANIDVLFIATSCNEEFNIARLERYLILARSAGIQPVVLLTKADLCDDVAPFVADAQKLDPLLPVIALNALNKTEVEPLLEWWRAGQTAALLGSSGVGKTTLLNSLTEASFATGDVREGDSKGRHTTTGRGLYALPGGHWMVDTPGMRELGLFDVADGVEAVFDDIISLSHSCRFSDCQHTAEPDCAIQNAIETGDLDPDRFKRWQKLMREEQRNGETIAQARQRFRTHGRRMRTISAERMEAKGKKKP